MLHANVTPSPTLQRSELAMMLVGWMAMMVVCAIWLTSYSYTAGANQPAPESWGEATPLSNAISDDELPSAQSITRKEGLATVLFFVHPRCPCSWASARQLARTLSAAPNDLPDTQVYLYQPGSQDLSWGETQLARYVSELPGCRTKIDLDGSIAKEFGAMTSGTVVVYNSDGDLEYSGGITSSRGHEGDSIGSRAIHAILNQLTPDHRQAPVFGCELFGTADSQSNSEGDA